MDLTRRQIGQMLKLAEQYIVIDKGPYGACPDERHKTEKRKGGRQPGI